MRLLFVLLGGALFGLGLGLSGMAKQEVVLSFLQLRDFGLMVVMGGGVAVSALAFRLGRGVLGRPLIGSFEPYRAALRPRTLIGAAVFGLGWGVSGICPGSALASLGLGNWPISIGIAGMFAGAYLQARIWPE